MEPQSNDLPLIVIVGETASGKSDLALAIAELFDGEIIAADSRTVYRGMDIGTAKPSRAEQNRVRHHLVDIATPDHPITAAAFKRLADAAIKDISAKGRVPILVGGTGLYIDAVIYNYSFAPKGNIEERLKLETLSVPELQQYLQAKNIPLPANSMNRRHLIRQAETGGMPSQPRNLAPGTLVLGVRREPEEIKQRIAKRVDAMFAAGLEQEVRTLAEVYGWDVRAMQTIGYQEFYEYFKGSIDRKELRTRVIRNSVQYAKRQRTWFRRNKDIHWICNQEEAIDLVTTLLNK